MVPATLVRKYLVGSVTDSPTSDRAAKCSTPSNPAPTTSPSAGASRTSTSTKVAFGGTAQSWPLDRLSATVTGVPGVDQLGGDHAADVAGPTHHEKFHRLTVSKARPGAGYAGISRVRRSS